MAENKFERKARKQITRIDEGLFSRFWKKILNRKFIKAAKFAQRDPALKAAFDAHEQATKDLWSVCDSAAETYAEVEKGIRSDPTRTEKQKLKALRELGFDV